MMYLDWFIIIATSVMAGVCVLAAGLWAVQRRAMNRYWGGGT